MKIKNPAIMHLLVALVWLFVSGNITLAGFFVAFIATFLLLSLFRKAIGCEDYVRRVKAFLWFTVRFVQDVIASNIRIMRVALRRDAGEIDGRYVNYNVEGLTEFEILLISQCIGLSPGTMVAEMHEDGKHLILHAFPASTAGDIQQKLDSTLKRGILSFTR